MNGSRNTTGRRMVHDLVHIHEYASAGRALLKRARVRVFEQEGELPFVVLSSPDGPEECTIPDVERFAAEVMLRLYPREALLARPHTPWFELIEHLPESYDALHWPISKHRRRDNLCEVTFSNYRVTVGGLWPVLRPRKALRVNTRAHYGIRRLTFGSPSWGPRLTLEEVEERVGARFGDAFGAKGNPA